jgi:hypothetical protein
LTACRREGSGIEEGAPPRRSRKKVIIASGFLAVWFLRSGAFAPGLPHVCSKLTQSGLDHSFARPGRLCGVSPARSPQRHAANLTGALGVQDMNRFSFLLRSLFRILSLTSSAKQEGAA